MTPVEIELKFILPPGAAEAVEQHPLLADVPASKQRLVSTYFDTPSCALRSRGFSLRVRKGSHGWVQTLKGTGSFGARDEWEWPLQTGDPDFARLLEARIDPSLAATVAASGHEVFVTDIERTERYVKVDGEGTIAAAIDTGVIRAGNRGEDVAELELELKHGNQSAAFELAGALAARANLRINPYSKAERGYHLIIGKTEAVKSSAPKLARDVTVAEAMPTLVASALRQFVANIPAAESGDVEGVHQMRIALRRLRTLLVLFAPEIEPCSRERISESIRALGTPLGAARDWDVFVGETLPAAEEADINPQWIAAFRDAAEPRRRAAHKEVGELIAGPRPTEFVLAVGTWSSTGEWAGPGRAPSSRRLRPASRKLLDRIARKIGKRGRGMPDLRGTALHALRKSVKKLLYSVDYTKPLHRGSRRYAKACKTLQSYLGAINDEAVTARLIDELAPRDQPFWAPPAGALIAWNRTRTKTAHWKAVRAWRRFRRRKAFWTA